MVEVLLRRGLYDDFVAGAAWALLRLAGRCMGVVELSGELRRLGLDVPRGRLNRVLLDREGRVFARRRNGSRIVYCALEEV